MKLTVQKKHTQRLTAVTDTDTKFNFANDVVKHDRCRIIIRKNLIYHTRMLTI